MSSKPAIEQAPATLDLAQFYSKSLSHQRLKFTTMERNNRLLLAKGGSDGSVGVYDVGTGKCHTYFSAHSEPVGDVMLSPHPFHKNSALLVSCSGTRRFNSVASKKSGDEEEEISSEEEEEEGERVGNGVRLWEIGE